MSVVTPIVETVPLTMEDGQTLRIGGSRITLDIVASYFRQGDSPEQIVEMFPTLRLADVYAVVGWMLRHEEEVNEYLTIRAEKAAELRAKVEEWCPPEGFREELAARKANSP